MYAKVMTKEHFNYNANGSINLNLNSKIKQIENLYSEVRLKVNNKNLFEKPKNIKGLKFGYICPGAINTIQYLYKNSKTIQTKKIVSQLLKLTDALFFVEIIVIYKNYISINLFKKAKSIIGDHCELSNQITKRISNLFAKLPKYLKKNLPDDFYHIRHDTLICSNNKKLATKRINMLKSFYKKETFTSHQCLNKRDGVSGCRDCCSKKYSNNYNSCVDSCMKY